MDHHHQQATGSSGAEQRQAMSSSQSQSAAAQHRSASSSPPPSVLAVSDRQRALQEAQQVTEALTIPLDSFNLLGVVANPRGGSMHGPSLQHANANATNTNYSSSNNNNNNNMMMGGASGNAAFPSSRASVTSSTDFAADSLHLLEHALHSVTEQIDAINVVFDSWSRHYLGNIYEDYEEYVPPTEIIGQLDELPPEMANLKLHTVQRLLQDSGELSHQFRQRSRERETWHWGESDSPPDDDDEPRRLQVGRSNASMDRAASKATNGEPAQNVVGVVSQEDSDDMLELEALVPSIFFQTYFDLTDPVTFCELLVGDQDDGDAVVPLEPSEDLSYLPDALSVPTRNLLQLPPPDHFTGLLDKVELALLKQVRSRSTAFFHETNRFGQLKDWIASLVQEVQRVRSVLDHVQDKSVVAWELIPLLDKQRRDLHVLRDVLEGANEVFRCKASVGGLLSANDDQSAAEQIQYGRRLLDGTLEEEECGFQLGRLQALSTVGDQLSQYESLVVANLGDELVEIFLSWNTTPNFKVSEVQPRIHNIVNSLSVCQTLDKTGQLYASRLNDVIRVTVRTTIGEFAEEADSSVKVGVTSMTLERFLDCLDMLFEQLVVLLTSAVGVNEFCKEQNISFRDGDDDKSDTDKEVKSATAEAVASAAELSAKSISELLRLRQENHSLLTLPEMKRLWDVCMAFILQLEKLSHIKASGLGSTLLSQAKAFVERKHEANMSSLVAALDSERWTQCEVSIERQTTLTRLCEGRAVWATPTKRAASASIEAAHSSSDKNADAEVEGVRYKVVWSCLLLVEMVLTNMACASHFRALAANLVGKVAELLRLFNSRSTQLVLGAGAMHSAARLKSINAKHLSLVAQCLGMIIAILPHVRASLMAQLPAKQHTLLHDLDKIKKEYTEHNEKVLNKFVTIIGGIVEHGLAPRINNTDFDERSRASVGPADGALSCCAFLDGVSTNTRKMHKVVSYLLPPDHLQDVFSRIFAYVDQKVPELFIIAAAGIAQKPPAFSFPKTEEGKKQMLLEMEAMTTNLNDLAGVRPWEFTGMAIIERKLDYRLRENGSLSVSDLPVGEVHADPTQDLSADRDGQSRALYGHGGHTPSVGMTASDADVFTTNVQVDDSGSYEGKLLTNGEGDTSDAQDGVGFSPGNRANGEVHQVVRLSSRRRSTP